MKVQTRKATMTNKERVEALLRGERPDRVPFIPGGGGFDFLYYGYTLSDQYTKSPEFVYEIQRKGSHEFDWVFTPALRAPRGRWLFGGDIKLPTSKYSQAQYVVKHVAETVEDVWALKPPDVRTCIPPEEIEFYKRIRQEEDDNRAYITFGCLSPTTAADIVGAETLCKWMIQKPEVAHHLLRLMTDLQIAIAQYVKDTLGVEGIVATGGNPSASNQLISPKHFGEFCLPYLKESHEKVAAMGFKYLQSHPCGEQNLNLPHYQKLTMGERGIWRIGDEIDVETMAKLFPNDIVAGNLNTSIIQVGTPDEVYEASRKLIERGKLLDTGFILTPACGLPPLAPAENMRAIVRAVNDFGWYD